MTPSSRILALTAVVTLAACSRTPMPAGEAAPAAPEAAIAAFLSAVDSNDIARMATLWGTDRGPSTVTVPDVTAREQRLVILQRVLQHESFRFVPPPAITAAPPGRRILYVELARGERRTTVPFTVVAQRAGGWLVENIGIESLMPAANPRSPSAP